MKKILWLSVGIVAVLISLAAIGPLAVLALSVALTGGSIYLYNRTSSKVMKVFLVLVAIVSAVSAISNIPALIGIATLALTYYVYKKLTTKSETTVIENNDPFANFEREWAKISK